MLKGIDPLLTGRLLKILDEMGHGDQLLLVDRNYPAASSGRPVVGLARWESSARWRPSSACSHWTSSSNTRWSGWRSTAIPGGRRRNRMPSWIWRAPRTRAALEWGVVTRTDFYERSRASFAVVHTLEPQPWGCFILTKGVVFPD